MLVLSRKPNESICIGDLIKVTVVRIGPNNVRLGIDAPRDMNIRREEIAVRDAIARESSPVDDPEPDQPFVVAVAEAVSNIQIGV